MPVRLVVVSAGHSSATSTGIVSTGAVVSFTVIVCAPVAVLLHWSTAFQVRVMTFDPPQPAVTLSMKVTVTVPQASVAVAAPVAAGWSRGTFQCKIVRNRDQRRNCILHRDRLQRGSGIAALIHSFPSAFNNLRRPASDRDHVAVTERNGTARVRRRRRPVEVG